MGCSQISRLNQFVLKRNKIAKFYNNIFQNDPVFTIPRVKHNHLHAYHIYPLLVNFNKLKKSKKKYLMNLKKTKINLQVHYIPINMQPYYKRNINLKKKKFF